MIRRVTIVALLAAACAAYGQGWDLLGALWTEPMASAVSQLGGAVDLDGTEYLTDTSSNVFGAARPDMSIALWMRCSSITANDGILVSRGGVGYFIIEEGTAATSSNLYVYLSDGNLSATVYTSNGVLKANSWQHLVVTTTNGSIKIYVNGVDVTAVSGGINNWTQYRPWRIGYDEASSDRKFTGIIDDVSIWGRRLITNEISELYGNGTSPKRATDLSTGTNGLVRYWKLDDGLANSSATQALDSVTGTYAPGTGIGAGDWTNGIVPQ